MCGIVGYVGKNEFGPDVVINGLRRLEYRGYDSAGLAIRHNPGEHVDEQYGWAIENWREVGGVDDLYDSIPEGTRFNSQCAIGHTRWATHGEPSRRNAHPHTSMGRKITLVHNGIIENYETLKKKLIQEGYEFESQTDTEVLANWIEYIWDTSTADFVSAVRFALKDVVGAYALLILTPLTDQVVMAKVSSPLAIGIGDEEFIIASDATPIVEYTKDIVYLEDGQIAVISDKTSLKIMDLDAHEVDATIERVELELDQIEKGGYDSFMLKEIHEQPESVQNCLRGRLTDGEEPLMMGGVENVLPNLLRANKIFIIACGTSWHAGLIGKSMIEKLTRIPVEVDYASEFRYKDPIIRPGDVVISISQSGETADTKAAMEMARERGATLFGIVNSVGSSIARLADAGIYTHSGVEIGVASTKAFTGQVAALALLAIKMARQLNSITDNDYVKLKTALKHIPGKIKSILDDSNHIFEVATTYSADEYKDFLYLARGINFPVALEGSLKLKEISYIHAEGYPAGEMKHGPIALIDETCPSIFIVPNDSSYGKVVSNMQEVKARKGKIIAIVTKGDELIRTIADEVIEIPETEELLTPLLTVIPLQLFSYKVAVQRGCNVDKPRNLAKSVTVE
jgi:glucosamine--fructose-6-phosphate aminotransferase (isomerizing)